MLTTLNGESRKYMCNSIEAARKLALYFKGASCSPLFGLYIAVIDTR